MRATRGYIAGFGTAGSLVACAAMVFVLASAVVAFRGWPQVGSASAPSSIIVGKLARATPSGVNRQLAAVAAASTTGAGGSGGGAATSRVTTRHSTTGAAQVATTGSRSDSAGAQQSSSVAPPTQPSQPTGPSSGCGSSCASPPGNGNPVSPVIGTVTSGLGSTVTSATQSLGSTVSGVAKVIATKLGLGQTGSAAATVVNGAGTLVTGAGKAVGGLLGGN